MKALNELNKGDKIRVFGCTCYFGGITTSVPNQVFTLHVTDLSGVVRRFRIYANDLKKQVDVLIPSFRTHIERVDLYERLKRDVLRPTTVYWLF